MALSMTAPPANRAREYETIYILRPDVDPDTADKVAGRVAEVVAREQGKLVKVENWGRRRLAYDVAKQRRGVYTYMKFLGGGALVTELERNLRMLDSVLRFQTVLVRSDVVLEAVTIDPEEVVFTRLEAPAEEEKDESRERLLGLVDAPDERRGHRRNEAVGEEDDDDGDDLDGISMNPDLADTDEEK